MYGWQQGELQIWSGSERVNHFWELKGHELNFPFVFKFAVNWLQRTKNAAKQSISPLTDMQHVNRSVEQSVILRILCTVLLQCYFNSLYYIICGKYKFPWHEDHSYFTFALLDCDCFDVGLSVAMGEWGPHSHKHKLNMADFILNMPLRFFARVFGNPAGDPVLLKSRGVMLLCDTLAQNLPTNLLWNRLWFVIGIKSTFKREL